MEASTIVVGILGTKLLLLVDFCDQILKQFSVNNMFCFILEAWECLETCVNCVTKCVTDEIYPNESPIFRNNFFLINFKDNLGHFFTVLKQHYENSFFNKKIVCFLF